MKRIFTVTAVLAGTLVSGAALAQGMSYNYVDVAYGSYNYGPGPTISGTGFSLNGSYDVTPNINLVGTYDSGSFNGGTITDLTLGVGYHMPMGGWDFISDLRYRTTDIASIVSPTGYAINVGGRVAASSQLELRGTVGYTSLSANGVSQSGTQFDIGGVYHVNQSWGVTADYFDDPNSLQLNGIRIGARFTF